jgi:hypothetical protein
VSQQPAPAAANSPAESCATALCLGADEQVSISPAGRATSVRKVQSEAEVGWASGQLVFENETIAEIAHRFNLYNRTQIQVLDADLAARRISGIFRVSDPESFVAFVQSVAGAQVAQRDSNHIALGSQAQTNNGTVAAIIHRARCRASITTRLFWGKGGHADGTPGLHQANAIHTNRGAGICSGSFHRRARTSLGRCGVGDRSLHSRCAGSCRLGACR